VAGGEGEISMIGGGVAVRDWRGKERNNCFV
jgi:hypothetical protein